MPWRETRVPYRILVSEFMLQQTGIERVRTKYAGFLRAFPGFRALAAASVEEVLAAWKGLGYNRRALALREAARCIVETHHDRMPRTVETLMELPGIGHATASAVLVYSFNAPIPFIETNIRRVFIHFFFPRGRRVTDSMLMPLVEKTLDRDNPREWHYALMDYGAMLGKTSMNANMRSARYRRQAAFEGSLRQLRGKILAAMLERGPATEAQIVRAIGSTDERLGRALSQLVDEGFLLRRGRRYSFR
jgi:A/G-specific adenine glycosylase